MRSSLHRQVALAVLAFSSFIEASMAGTRVWSGSAGELWSNPANWDGSVPLAGDNLVFPDLTVGGAITPKSTNDLAPGMTFGLITIGKGAYVIGGNAIALTDGIRIDAWKGGATALTFASISVARSQTWSSYCNPLTPYSNGCAPPTENTISLGPIQLQGNSLTVSGNSRFLIPSISGSGTFTGFVSEGRIGPSTLLASVSGSGFILDHVNCGDVSISNGDMTLLGSNVGHIVLGNAGVLQVSDKAASSCGGLASLAIGTEWTGLEVLAPLDVKGMVVLGNAALWGVPSGTAPTLPLIVNDGDDAVVGTFRGLPEGTLITISNLTYAITYGGGDGNDVMLIQSAPAARSVTSLTVSDREPLGGQEVTFTAVSSGGSCGRTMFYEGSKLLGPVGCSSENATLTMSFTPGTHDVFACYTGGSGYAASVFGISVDFGATRTVLSASPRNPVALTASVSGRSIPTGSVTFFDQTAALVTVPLDENGHATGQATLEPGPHTLTATYSGSASFAPSTGSISLNVDADRTEDVPALSVSGLLLLSLLLAAAAVITLRR